MRVLGLTVRLCVVQAITWEVQWMLRYRVRKEEYDEAAQVCLLRSTLSAVFHCKRNCFRSESAKQNRSPLFNIRRKLYRCLQLHSERHAKSRQQCSHHPQGSHILA